jgi:hypothetical protein
VLVASAAPRCRRDCPAASGGGASPRIAWHPPTHDLVTRKAKRSKAGGTREQ